jgi:hypothetical protein
MRPPKRCRWFALCGREAVRMVRVRIRERVLAFDMCEECGGLYPRIRVATTNEEAAQLPTSPTQAAEASPIVLGQMADA